MARLSAKERAARRTKKHGGKMDKKGNFDVGKRLTGGEMRHMVKDQGMSVAEAKQMARDQGAKIGKNAKKFGAKYNARQKAKEKAQKAPEANRYVEPVNVNDPIDHGGTPMQPSKPAGGNVSVGGNLDQNIGKTGDMTTTIGDGNTFGAGANIGNDYSVTIGSQTVGGTGGEGGGSGLDNMMTSQAYNALNDNAWAKSQSQLNGYSRAAGAIEEAEKATGATNRVAALYNMVGQDQQYWSNKATAHQGDYLGDIFKIRAPDWTMPSEPEKVEDKTEEIASDFADRIEDV